MKNKIRLQIGIKPNTNKQLVELLKDDSNRISSSKVRKGDLVDLALRLLYQTRKNQTLEEIDTYVKKLENMDTSINGGGNYE